MLLALAGGHDGSMPTRLPQLSPEQVLDLQDALLNNADGLLSAALAEIHCGNPGRSQALAILGVEESAKAIALHERRVAIAFGAEGEPFVDDRLQLLWSDHREKLRLVHSFLIEERYWFGYGPPDAEENRCALGAMNEWVKRHNLLKQRGFYVDVDDNGDVLAPQLPADEKSLAAVIGFIHQIGWQLRLGEHIEARGQELAARRGKLNNEAYRLRLPERGRAVEPGDPRPGFEAQARELARLRTADHVVGALHASERGRKLME